MNDLAPVESDIAAGEEVNATPGTEAGEAWIFPTSFAQRRLWFLDQVEPGATLYNVPGAYLITGHVEPGLLERSFAEVVARHEILRTTFRAVEGEPMQIVAEHGDFRLQVLDRSGLSGAAWAEEVRRVVRAESERPFDLGNGPLLRALLLGHGPAEQALVVCVHHIITDSWSQEVMMREVTAIYSALARGEHAALPELPIQYADFAAWQRDAMQGETLERETNFWRARLAGLEALELPGCPAVSSGQAAGETHEFKLPAALATGLRTLAQREGVTLFMTMLAGWKAFLCRYTGQTDLAVGSPISHRSRTETEGLIGLFLNTLVLRTDLAGNPTVRELLHRVRATALEGFAHQEMPFEMMVEDLQPPRLPGKSPLLRVMFVLMSGEEARFQCPGATFEPLPVEESKAKFDLMLHLRDTAGGINAALVYDRAVIDGATARRIAGHYTNLLAGMAEHPDTTIDQLPLGDAEEERRVLREWNDTARPYPQCGVHAIFAEQAARRPGAVAVVDGAEQVTYGELDARAEAVRAALVRQGLQAGETVAIALDRSAGLIAGILGILKAGGVYVPLDSSYPRERLALMLRESGARFVIVRDEEEATLDSGVVRLGIRACLREAPLAESAADGTGREAAYIMFTSGSTGEPKGACIPHRGISRLVINTNYVDFRAEDVVAHASNTSFDASTFEIWGALLNGARLVIVPKATLVSPDDLLKLLEEKGITVLFLTTPLFHHFAREMPGAFAKLRYLVAGGDALQAQAARAVLAAGAPGHLINGYGPTEVTTFAICHEVRDISREATSVPIGRPISNTRAYILDGGMRPCPIGIPGELYLGGPGVALGYLNRPELTKAKFIPDPFTTSAGDHLYRTGDLARWCEDGTIDFLGRADNQVKIRGFRIEPGEIEAALQRLDGVKAAIVTARTNSAGQKQLVAYVAPRAGVSLNAARLRERLLAVLPEYMVPATFGFVDELPLNANGKVDFNALSSKTVLETERTREGPGTWLEAALIEVWEEILDRQGIGVTDDFFDLGGHSLLAMRMLAQVEKKTGIKIAPRMLFEGATIRHLAASTRRQGPAGTAAIVQVQAEGGRTPMFFLHGDFVEGGLYCVKMARYLGADRPFYAIDPHGVPAEAPRSIEEMAADRLKLVRAEQERGPYVLGGFCNGGLVAFEMARQLEEAGEKVASLILISVDGSNAEFAWLESLIGMAGHLSMAQKEQRFRAFLQWRERILFARAALTHQMTAISKVPVSQQPAKIARKTARVARKAMSLLLPRPVDPSRKDSALPEAASIDLGLIYQEACTAYVPRPLKGPAHLLWPEELPLNDPLAGWEKPMPNLKVTKVPGGHFSSLQGRNLEIVSERMRECLLADHA